MRKRKWRRDILSVCFDVTASCLNLLSRSCLRAHTQDSPRPLAALRLSGSLPVSLRLQAAGILLHRLSSQQPAVELRPSNMPRCGETSKALLEFSGDIPSNFPIMWSNVCVLQILTNAKSKRLPALKTWSASTCRVPSFAQVGSDCFTAHPVHVEHAVPIYLCV